MGSSFDPSRSRSDKSRTLTNVEEEINMSNLGALPAGSYSSTEILKGDTGSERSSESLEDTELGNHTNVTGAGKDFDWSRRGSKTGL
jgi:hypothetical protein